MDQPQVSTQTLPFSGESARGERFVVAKGERFISTNMYQICGVQLIWVVLICTSVNSTPPLDFFLVLRSIRCVHLRDLITYLSINWVHQNLFFPLPLAQPLDPISRSIQCIVPIRQGFSEGLDTVWIGEGMLDKLREMHAQSPRPIFVTGHSLGAALATIAAARLAVDHDLPLQALYTVGSPRFVCVCVFS